MLMAAVLVLQWVPDHNSVASLKIADRHLGMGLLGPEMRGGMLFSGQTEATPEGKIRSCELAVTPRNLL